MTREKAGMIEEIILQISNIQEYISICNSSIDQYNEEMVNAECVEDRDDAKSGVSFYENEIHILSNELNEKRDKLDSLWGIYKPVGEECGKPLAGYETEPPKKEIPINKKIEKSIQEFYKIRLELIDCNSCLDDALEERRMADKMVFSYRKDRVEIKEELDAKRDEIELLRREAISCAEQSK